MFEQKARCGNCLFYHETAKVCRRFPPTTIMLGLKQSLVQANAAEPQLGSFFPGMQSNGWCGEHQPKLEDLEDA